MAGFGAETSKPQYAYSNSPEIRTLKNFESSSLLKKVKKNHVKVETCRKYKNKDGKDCYVGTSRLKGMEILECAYVERKHFAWVYDMFLLCFASQTMYRSVHALCSIPGVTIKLPRLFPRIYPDLFGLTISEIIEDLKRCKFGCPDLPDQVPKAVESFKESKSGKDWGLFDHADLEAVFRYLRKGTNLQIPKEWEELVPKRI